MSFNDTVRAAILRVSDVSNSARNIAHRLHMNEGKSVTASDVTDVDALKAEIERLNQQLSDLRLYITSTEDDDDDGQTDAQRQQFVDRFAASLGTQSFAVLSSVYDEDYFDKLSPRTRYALSVVLVNWCSERKFKPSELWYNLMVNNGSL